MTAGLLLVVVVSMVTSSAADQIATMCSLIGRFINTYSQDRPFLQYDNKFNKYCSFVL